MVGCRPHRLFGKSAQYLEIGEAIDDGPYRVFQVTLDWLHKQFPFVVKPKCGYKDSMAASGVARQFGDD